MRIAELVNNLEIGGAERMVVDLALALRSRGHVPHVICLRQAGALAETLRESGVEVLAMQKPDGFNVRTLCRIASYFHRQQIDVIHTHNPLVHHYGALAGRIAGVPVVINTRHGLGNFPRTRWNETMTEAVFSLSSCLTDRVVSLCKAAEDYFEHHTYVPKRKLHVIPNGIDLQRFAHIEPAVPASGTVFGTVGRLVPVKDHRTLLEAFAIVLHRNPSCRLEILGDGPLRHDLADLSHRLGLADAVSFRGASFDVPGFLARLQVFVLASVSEGLPLTVLEAMASGLPVVATAVGGVPDLVRADTGWLCPPSDPTRLAEAMLTASAAEERPAMGARARQHARARFSTTRMAREYERLFEELLIRRCG